MLSHTSIHSAWKAISGKETEFGFTITPKRSRRHPSIVLTDLDFADDIALLSDDIDKAQKLLSAVEGECMKVGLGLNAKKTKSLAYNIDNPTPLHTSNGTNLAWVDDFKYLGSWVDATDKDINVRKALAWQSLNGMNKIWKSNLNTSLKVNLFIATVECVLLYGCESWTLTSTQEKALNGSYTRMLRVVKNVHWSDRIPNTELYGKLPSLSNKIASRRLQLAGHCFRHPELSTHHLILWEPKHGHRRQGRPKQTFVDTLRRDTGTHNSTELATLMSDRSDWRRILVGRLRPTR